MCGCNSEISGMDMGGVDMELLGGAAIGAVGGKFLDKALTKIDFIKNNPTTGSALKIAGGVLVASMGKESGALVEGVGIGLVANGAMDLLGSLGIAGLPAVYPNRQSISLNSRRHLMPGQQGRSLPQRSPSRVPQAQNQMVVKIQ